MRHCRSSYVYVPNHVMLVVNIMFYYVLAFVGYVHFATAILRPVVLWHGLGDCGGSGDCGVISRKEYIEKWIPGIYVKSISMHSIGMLDTASSFTKNVNNQISSACKQIRKDEKLKNGYNAIGFSQGGQFLRAVAQRCSEPRMYNLITFGAQHQGIYGIPGCDNDHGYLCSLYRSLAKDPYGYIMQHKFVPAQYWHDPFQEELYRKKSNFLGDINSENGLNQQYKDNLRRLENFVMVKYTFEWNVIPDMSSWFGYYKPGSKETVLTLQETALYKDEEDRLGLREMDKNGKLHFYEIAGMHLQFFGLKHKYKVIFQNFLSGGEVKKLDMSMIADEEEEDDVGNSETLDKTYDSIHASKGGDSDKGAESDKGVDSDSDGDSNSAALQAEMDKILGKF